MRSATSRAAAASPAAAGARAASACAYSPPSMRRTASASRVASGPAQRRGCGRQEETHCTRLEGFTSVNLTGAFPGCARAASPLARVMAPCSLLMSTTPDSTTSCVLPSGPTSTSQSVPRMPMVAVAVVRRTRWPAWPGIEGGRARLQMRPVTSRSTDTRTPEEGSAAASITIWLFGCRRIWVRSGISSAIWLSPRVRMVAPAGSRSLTPVAVQGPGGASRRSALPTSITTWAPPVAACTVLQEKTAASASTLASRGMGGRAHAPLRRFRFTLFIRYPPPADCGLLPGRLIQNCSTGDGGFLVCSWDGRIVPQALACGHN